MSPPTVTSQTVPSQTFPSKPLTDTADTAISLKMALSELAIHPSKKYSTESFCSLTDTFSVSGSDEAQVDSEFILAPEKSPTSQRANLNVFRHLVPNKGSSARRREREIKLLLDKNQQINKIKGRVSSSVDEPPMEVNIFRSLSHIPTLLMVALLWTKGPLPAPTPFSLQPILRPSSPPPSPSLPSLANTKGGLRNLRVSFVPMTDGTPKPLSRQRKKLIAAKAAASKLARQEAALVVEKKMIEPVVVTELVPVTPSRPQVSLLSQLLNSQFAPTPCIFPDPLVDILCGDGKFAENVAKDDSDLFPTPSPVPSPPPLSLNSSFPPSPMMQAEKRVVLEMERSSRNPSPVPSQQAVEYFECEGRSEM